MVEYGIDDDDVPLLDDKPEGDSKQDKTGDAAITRSPSACLRNLWLGNVVVCLLMVSSNFYRPVMSQYVYHRVSVEVFGNDTRADNFSTLAPCFQNTTDPGYLLQEQAQIQSSQKLLQYTVLYSGIAVVSNLFLGTYSDFLGRKFLYVVCITGYLLQAIVTIVIIHWDMNLDFFYVANGLYGLTGASWSYSLVACAYAADNTPPQQSRSFWMAIIESVVWISSGFASLAAGYFIQDTGYFYPCLTSAIISILNIIIVIIFMEETCPRQSRACISPIEGLRNMFRVYIHSSSLKTGLLWLGLLIFFFSIINNSGASNLDTLFEMNLPFCWSPEKIGWFSTVTFIGKCLVGVFIVRGLQYCMADEMVAVVATISAIAGDVVWGFATQDWMLYAGVPVLGVVGFAATPVIRGIMSKMAPQDKQGALFASLALVESTCGTFGTPLFNKVYQATVSYWRGAMYIVMGAMHAAALLLYLVFIPFFRKEQRKSMEQDLNVQTKS